MWGPPSGAAAGVRPKGGRTRTKAAARARRKGGRALTSCGARRRECRSRRHEREGGAWLHGRLGGTGATSPATLDLGGVRGGGPAHPRGADLLLLPRSPSSSSFLGVGLLLLHLGRHAGILLSQCAGQAQQRRRSAGATACRAGTMERGGDGATSRRATGGSDGHPPRAVLSVWCRDSWVVWCGAWARRGRHARKKTCDFARTILELAVMLTGHGHHGGRVATGTAADWVRESGELLAPGVPSLVLTHDECRQE
ncbi:hypothetical protein PR202_gb02109 [Eleusine coracana subsp. coracana]|uniref:Uncharacterized protein n=1 Tax=Eleusine coracana subsp. coracana TaxID=191504 RepID=A0AAV5DXV3_ELECO|nr:hypothetical protein PR202_gb02109 [Eleusine coracana subsp. coracana]